MDTKVGHVVILEHVPSLSCPHTFFTSWSHPYTFPDAVLLYYCRWSCSLYRSFVSLYWRGHAKSALRVRVELVFFGVSTCTSLAGPDGFRNEETRRAPRDYTSCSLSPLLLLLREAMERAEVEQCGSIAGTKRHSGCADQQAAIWGTVYYLSSCVDEIHDSSRDPGHYDVCF